MFDVLYQPVNRIRKALCDYCCEHIWTEVPTQSCSLCKVAVPCILFVVVVVAGAVVSFVYLDAKAS